MSSNPRKKKKKIRNKTAWDALVPVISNPLVWGKFLPHIRLYFINLFLYGNVSTNANSRSYWNKKLKSKGRTWRVKAYNHVIPFFPTDKVFSVLDVGSALGDGPKFIEDTFPKAVVSGLEFSEVGIEVSKRKSKTIQWHKLDILKQSIPDVYDYVTIVHTLEHFDDPFFVLKKCIEAARISVIINVPYDENTNRRMFGVTEHRYFFDKTTFNDFNCTTTKLVDNGASIVYEVRCD